MSSPNRARRQILYYGRLPRPSRWQGVERLAPPRKSLGAQRTLHDGFRSFDHRPPGLRHVTASTNGILTKMLFFAPFFVMTATAW